MSFIMLRQFPYLLNLLCLYRVRLWISLRSPSTWIEGLILYVSLSSLAWFVSHVCLWSHPCITWSWWIIILIFDWISFLVLCWKIGVFLVVHILILYLLYIMLSFLSNYQQFPLQMVIYQVQYTRSWWFCSCVFVFWCSEKFQVVLCWSMKVLLRGRLPINFVWPYVLLVYFLLTQLN